MQLCKHNQGLDIPVKVTFLLRGHQQAGIFVSWAWEGCGHSCGSFLYRGFLIIVRWYAVVFVLSCSLSSLRCRPKELRSWKRTSSWGGIRQFQIYPRSGNGKKVSLVFRSFFLPLLPPVPPLSAQLQAEVIPIPRPWFPPRWNPGGHYNRVSDSDHAMDTSDAQRKRQYVDGDTLPLKFAKVSKRTEPTSQIENRSRCHPSGGDICGRVQRPSFYYPFLLSKNIAEM